jgi:hypothetical protein
VIIILLVRGHVIFCLHVVLITTGADVYRWFNPTRSMYLSLRCDPPLLPPRHSPTVEEEEQLELVVAAAKGVFGYHGGILMDAGVSLIIPQGAIPQGKQHEIFFKVCRTDDPCLLPPLEKGEGECVCCFTPLIFYTHT